MTLIRRMQTDGSGFARKPSVLRRLLFRLRLQVLYNQADLGWLQFRPFQDLLETFIQRQGLGYGVYRAVYSAWF